MRISDWSSDVCSSDLYNDLAWPDNEAVLAELLAVRAERAHLLGYADWAEFEADVRMIGTGGAIPEFLARLDDASAAAAEREYARILDRLRVDEPHAAHVTIEDFGYLLAAVKREAFALAAHRNRKAAGWGKRV